MWARQVQPVPTCLGAWQPALAPTLKSLARGLPSLGLVQCRNPLTGTQRERYGVPASSPEALSAPAPPGSMGVCSSKLVWWWEVPACHVGTWAVRLPAHFGT